MKNLAREPGGVRVALAVAKGIGDWCADRPIDPSRIYGGKVVVAEDSSDMWGKGGGGGGICEQHELRGNRG